MNSGELITKACTTLSEGYYSDRPHVQSGFKGAKFMDNDVQTVSNAVAVCSYNDGSIQLYPLLNSIHEERAIFEMLRAYGNLSLASASDALKEHWEYKLCLPEASQIESIQERLAANAHEDYSDFIQSFSTCMDRWVALNVMNALIKNNVLICDTVNLDLKAWGSTSRYSKLLTYHTIIPQLGAYAPEEMSDYGYAFAATALEKTFITESSVHQVFTGIVDYMTSMLR